MSKFALLFLLIFFGGLVGALFSSPVIAVVLYQLVYFMNPESRWWGASIPSLSYSFITVVVMLITLVIHYGKLSKSTRYLDNPVSKWILLLFLVYCLMSYYALVPLAHEVFLFNFLKLLIITLISYKLIDNPKSLDFVCFAYIAGAAYVGYYAGFVGRNSAGRVEGIGMIDTGGDANHTAAALVPALIFILHYVWLGSYKVKLFCIICAAFIVNGLVLINSRGSFIGCVVGASIFLGHMIFSSNQKKGQKAMAFGVIFFGLAGALSLTDQSFWDRMSTLKEVEDGSASGSHRVDFWLATFSVMKDYPMGVGINGFEAVSRFYLPEHYFERNSAKAVHSSWFQLLAEAGWLGVLFFFIAMHTLFKLAKVTKKFLLDCGRVEYYFHVLCLEASLLGYFSAATFINRIRAESMWWCIVILMIATNVYYLQYKDGHEKNN